MSVLTIIGGIVVVAVGLIAIGAALNFFIFEPRRRRDFEQNYRRRSMDATGPFWWIPGPAEKRPHPVPAPEAEGRVRIRQLQFVLLLALIAISILGYKLFF